MINAAASQRMSKQQVEQQQSTRNKKGLLASLHKMTGHVSFIGLRNVEFPTKIYVRLCLSQSRIAQLLVSTIAMFAIVVSVISMATLINMVFGFAKV